MSCSDGPGCTFCEQAPPPSVRSGRLYLHFPLSHTFGKVRSLLQQIGLETRVDGAIITVELSDERLEELVDAFERGSVSYTHLRSPRD